MKDYFSKESPSYAKFRPQYPQEMIDYLLSALSGKKVAWDCGTGNGQLAVQLARYFEHVFATDISNNQLANAPKKENIIYRVERAEQSSFADNAFDLICVAQAIHWFDFEKFYLEVKRTLKPEGFFAVIGYSLMSVDKETDKIIDNLYANTLDGHWDPERKYVDDHYKTIPFPFREIESPEFNAIYDWSLEQFVGYIETWSAVQHYKNSTNSNPMEKIIDDLKKNWKGNEHKLVTFPMFMRLGKKL